MSDWGENLQRSKKLQKKKYLEIRQDNWNKIKRNKEAKTQREMTNVDKGPITYWGGNQRVIKRQKIQESQIEENIHIHMKYILNDTMSWKK